MTDEERTMTFVGHLDELRSRLIWCLATWVVATAISFPLAPKAIALLTHPLKAATALKPDTPRIVLEMAPLAEYGLVADGNPFLLVARLENVTTGTKRIDQTQVDIVLPTGLIRSIGEGAVTGSSFYYSNLIDPIWLIFKAALILGIILSLPMWVYQVWAFVRPGLRSSEKRVIRPLFAMCAVLFPCGVVFAYFLLRFIIGFLLSIQIARVSPMLNYATYAPWIIRILVGFGIVFEMPVAILLLTHLGVVTPTFLRKYRGYAYVIIAVLAMLVTPPDPISMVLMMGPLFALYEFSIILSYLAARSRAKAMAEEDEDVDLDDDVDDDDDEDYED